MVNSCSKCDLYKNLNFEYTSNIIPNTSINKPLDQDTIIKQFSKTNNSIYEFKKIEIILDDNLFLPISSLNDLRRTILENIEKQTLDKIKRTSNCCYTPIVSNASNLKNNYKISLLLNDLNLEYDYSKLDGVHNLYIPLKFFVNKNYENILKILEECHEAGVKGIICFGMGVTLREGSREYYYKQLDRLFPGMKEKYQMTYNDQYTLNSPHNRDLMNLFFKKCQEYQMMCNYLEIFEYLQEFEEKTPIKKKDIHDFEQLSLF